MVEVRETHVAEVGGGEMGAGVLGDGDGDEVVVVEDNDDDLGAEVRGGDDDEVGVRDFGN